MIRLRVKEVAKEQGMSMRQLVKSAGIAYNTLRTIYRDPYRPVSTETLFKLSRALGVPSSELIEDVKEKRPED